MEDEDIWQGKALQRMSFLKVVMNFPRILLAYKRGSNVPQRHFEFLQRAYSKELLEEISKISKTDLSDDELDFLINPYLKELNLNLLHYKDPEQILIRLSVMGKKIKAMSLKGQKLWSENHLTRLVSLIPSIETLDLSDTACSDFVLKDIANCCPLLIDLNISGCFAVSNEGLVNLLPIDTDCNSTKNTVLKNINLTGTSVTDFGIAFCLDNFPSLSILHIDGVDDLIYKKHFTTFDSKSMEGLPKYKLTNLDVDLKYFPSFAEVERKISTDTIKVCSFVCPNVTSLFVSGVSQQSEIDACSDFSKLEEVNLTFHRKSHCNLSTFLELRGKNLYKLGLFRAEISIEWLAKFCKKLRRLQLHRVKFINFDEKVLTDACFPDIVHLAFICDFNKSTVTKCVSSLMRSCPSLKSLSLRLCESLSEGVLHFILKNASLSNLEELDASRTDITIKSVREFFSEAPRLKKILLKESFKISSLDHSLLASGLKAEKRDVIIEWSAMSPWLADNISDDEMSVSDNIDRSSDSIDDASTSISTDDDTDDSMDEEDSFDEDDDLDDMETGDFND